MIESGLMKKAMSWLNWIMWIVLSIDTELVVDEMLDSVVVNTCDWWTWLIFKDKFN